MGWAIKRQDGTYRVWNRNAKDNALRDGETWEERDTPPTITRPPVTEGERQAAAVQALNADPIAEAIIQVMASLTGQPYGTVKNSVLAAYKVPLG